MEFFKRGRFEDFKVGISVAEVLEVAGDPDAITGPLPAIHLYGDLQLGFSEGGVLWYIALEPSGPEMALPGLPGARVRVKNFTFEEFANEAEVEGRLVVKCEPFVPGEYWWKFMGAEVFVQFDESGLLSVAGYSDRRLAN
ncbi:hypothetical protein VSH64_22285 [Amycolatopsis rhabdoformis]|uniref:Uncharacterized protein n=1 Tax=Amycolatopsis rhabdoformis TaxID=1448059 RepID=A0ABZ1IKR0_9PSEU|nr:hypothetical protein [Amycolatopsis rhabdoformis]WSE34775.1 hypothetical protein VSH64_22285 [Amycolatopsis rhabdoformis]